MPCSALDYRSESSAMPVPALRDSEYSRYNKINYSGTCSWKYSNYTTEPVVSKYTLTRGLGSRSSSLTDESRDRSATRDSLRTIGSSRSRTTSYTSDSTTLPKPRKPTYTPFDLDDFRKTYAPSSYLPGSHRAQTESKPPVSRRQKDYSVPALEVIGSSVAGTQLMNGAETKEKIIKIHLESKKVEEKPDSDSTDSGSVSPRVRKSSVPTSVKKELAPTSTATRHGLSGLRNIGNTCFMNSVVQCLSNTRPLKDFLVNKEYTSEIRPDRGSLITSFADVVSELWSEESQIVNTSSFKGQIQRFAPRFMGYNQQDAQEFLRYLLEGLHEDINRVAVKPKNLPEIDDNLSDNVKAAEAWKQYLRFDNSHVVDLFVGQLKSTLQCTTCQHSSTTFEAFWDLSLPLISGSGPVRLSQCLDHFTKEEVLDGHEMPTCSKCKTRRKCTKRFSIQKFPKILVLHLKRFSPSERYRKLTATVEFPLTNLDMSAYSSSRQQHPVYNLYAVSNHSGTAHSGHYTAYCLHSGTNQWYEFNDSRVSQISSRNVVSSEAYILFYEQSTTITASRL